MGPARSRGPEPLWQEVLRRAAVTLGGRAVCVWEADVRGRLHLLASSSEDLAPLAGELEAALRTLGELPGARPPPCRWVASRLEEQRWCIARVRRELPRPPLGVERRGRERVALELAGVWIGLLGDPDRQGALAGESVSYRIRLEGRCYHAHVEPLRNKADAIVGVVGVAVDERDRAPAPLDLEDFFENA